MYRAAIPTHRGTAMRYLHTMVRVKDVDASLDFYCNKLGMVEVRRSTNEKGRFTLIFLAASEDEQTRASTKAPAARTDLQLGPEDYQGGRNFGHLAYEVDDIYAACQRLMTMASPSTGRRATATWPSSSRPTASRSRSCRRASQGAGRALAVDAEYRQLVAASARNRDRFRQAHEAQREKCPQAFWAISSRVSTVRQLRIVPGTLRVRGRISANFDLPRPSGA
jgi:lactoylglutathione lyase